MDIGCAMNYQYLNEIDKNPSGDAPEWVWIGPGINTFTKDKSETTEEEYFYDKFGEADTQVTGMSQFIAVEGKRRYDDPCQNWVASLDEEKGEELCTTLRRTFPDGRVVERPVTVHEIKADQDGAPNEKAKFSCKLSFNGPGEEVKAPVGISYPESVTAEAVSVAVGSTATISATVTPTDANPRCLFATSSPKIATVTPDGTVKGVAAGKTKVTIRCVSKPSVTKQVEITVTAATQASQAAKASKGPSEAA